MLRKAFFSVTATVGLLPALAQTDGPPQEQKPTTTISGNADAYYKYDIKKSKANNLTSFTNSHNSFELGMASVKIEHKTSKVSMVADLGFGKRAQEFSYNDNGIVAAIKQLYVSYAPKSWVKFTAGSWATHIGYEVVDASQNHNYSMSYMFTNGPFFHTGVKADFTAGKHGFMIGVANPTDYKTAPSSGINKKFFLAQYSYAPSDKVKAYLNFVAGQFPDSSKNNQLDLVLTAKVTDKFSLGYNGTVSTTKTRNTGKYNDAHSWWGSALYVNVDASSWFRLSLREEYFSDKNHLKIVAGNSPAIFASTLSANFTIDNLIIIPEVRLDHSSTTIFTDENGGARANAGNFLVAVVYQF